MLGAILWDWCDVSSMGAILAPEDFANATHRRVFWACLALAERGEPVTLLAIWQLVKGDGTNTTATALADLFLREPPESDAGEEARRVRRLAEVRRLIETAEDCLSRARELAQGVACE